LNKDPGKLTLQAVPIKEVLHNFSELGQLAVQQLTKHTTFVQEYEKGTAQVVAFLARYSRHFRIKTFY
jgi:hypothetical protein